MKIDVFREERRNDESEKLASGNLSFFHPLNPLPAGDILRTHPIKREAGKFSPAGRGRVSTISPAGGGLGVENKILKYINL